MKCCIECSIDMLDKDAKCTTTTRGIAYCCNKCYVNLKRCCHCSQLLILDDQNYIKVDGLTRVYCRDCKPKIDDKEKFDFLYKKVSTMETEIEKLKTVQLKLLEKFDQQIIQSGAN